MIKKYNQKAGPLVTSGLKRIGMGCFAEVYGDNKHDYVVKTGCTEGDAYWKYIKKVARLKKHNPFFPKVKKIIVTGDRYYVVMERLKKIHHYCLWDVATNSHEAYYGMAEILIKRGRIDNYNKTELKKAIKLIESLGESPDIHWGNVMLRDKQLVITDPVC